MNQIGLGASARKLARFYQITGERNVAPSLAPEIVPVVVVDDISDIDTYADSEFRDFIAAPPMTTILGTAFAVASVNMSSSEQLLIRVRELWITCTSSAGAFATVILFVEEARVETQESYTARVRRAFFIPPLGPGEVFIGPRVTRNTSAIALATGSAFAVLTIPVGSTLVVKPEIFFGPGRAFSIHTVNQIQSVTPTIFFQERPLSRVGNQ